MLPQVVDLLHISCPALNQRTLSLLPTPIVSLLHFAHEGALYVFVFQIDRSTFARRIICGLAVTSADLYDTGLSSRGV